MAGLFSMLGRLFLALNCGSPTLTISRASGVASHTLEVHCLIDSNVSGEEMGSTKQEEMVYKAEAWLQRSTERGACSWSSQKNHQGADLSSSVHQRGHRNTRSLHRIYQSMHNAVRWIFIVRKDMPNTSMHLFRELDCATLYNRVCWCIPTITMKHCEICFRTLWSHPIRGCGLVEVGYAPINFSVA